MTELNQHSGEKDWIRFHKDKGEMDAVFFVT